MTLLRNYYKVASIVGRCLDALCNKLDAMNSSPACIMCFHISKARPCSLRNARACSRLTEHPSSLASRMRCEIVISAITRSLFLLGVMSSTPIRASKRSIPCHSYRAHPKVSRLVLVLSFRDSQATDLVLQGRALQSEPLGGSALSRNSPGRCSQCIDDHVGLRLSEARR